MPKAIIANSLRRNLINLTVVSIVLFFVFGCFCRSDRETESTNQTEPATDQNPNPRSKSTAAKNPSANNPESAKTDAGDFIVENNEVQNPRYRELDRQLKDEKVLENAAAQLNQSLSLPFDIYLRTKDCGEINAFYNPNDQSITVCYELMEYHYKLFKSAGDNDDIAFDKMNNAVRFAFLHEVGHALIDAYKLPIMGNEEDAADRCSAYISLEEIPDGVKYVLAAADAFALESKRSGSKQNMADEHLLQEQRFYNSLCMIYGSNPGKYSSLVNTNFLPKERAVRCPGEYERTMQSWKDLLKPWRKA